MDPRRILLTDDAAGSILGSNVKSPALAEELRRLCARHAPTGSTQACIEWSADGWNGTSLQMVSTAPEASATAAVHPPRRGAAVAGRTNAAPPSRPPRPLLLFILEPSPYVPTLSPTQHRVATLAANGLTVAEIALELGRSPATVRTHLGNIYARLGVSSRVELLQAMSGRW